MPSNQTEKMPEYFKDVNGKLRNMTSIYIQKDDKVLLLYRKGGRVVSNVWTGSAGGHFESFELNDAKACVLREMKEELELEPDDIEGLSLRYITLRHINGEIRQNYYFFAHLKDNVDEHLNSNEGENKWWHIDELSSLEMPFTAKYVVEHYFSQGCKTNILYSGVCANEQVTFLELD